MKQTNTPKNLTETKSVHPIRSLVTVYFLLIGLYLLCGFSPEWRMWGFNWWAYHPAWLVSLFVLIAVAIPVLIYRRGKKVKDTTAIPTSHVPFLVSGIIVSVLLTVGFITLPNATHFLGDGFTLIDRLATNAPLVKAWDFGASMINHFVYESLGGNGTATAERTFYLISLASGVLVLLCAGWFAWRQPLTMEKRFLVFTGIVTSGYMLQYFGYAENYALLVAGILIYTMLGVEAVRRRLNFWWLLAPLAVSLFIHLWAVALIPSFIYLMVRETKFGIAFAQMPYRKKRMIAIISFLVLVVIHQILYYSSYFFTFAFLPLIPDRFVVDNDWLFSPKHLLDMINLIMLLVPGTALLLVLFANNKQSKLFAANGYLFLLTVLIPALIMVYIFNPGIGMPRNWDLFSIAGPPLALFCFLFFTDDRLPRTVSLIAAFLAVTLNVLSLTPRVLAEADREIGITHFRNYMKLDPVRSRNATRLLVEYYKSIGDSAKAAQERELSEQEYPESSYGKKGRELMAQGKFAQAIPFFTQSIQINPLYSDGWANMGSCYLYQGKLDSALELLQIADGLNPYNAQFLANIGTVYLRKQDMPNAEANFQKALRSDSTQENALMGLAAVNVTLNKPDSALQSLRKLAATSELPSDYYLQAAQAMIAKSAYTEASEVLRLAREKGADLQTLLDLQNKYPELHLDN